MTTLKILSTLIWITAFGGKKSELTEYFYSVSFDENTKVAINGTSNINEFTCNYQSNFNSKTFNIYGNMQGKTMRLTNAVFNLDVKNFDCGHDIMTNDFKKTLKKDEYPQITMEITSIDFQQEENINAKQSMVYAHINVCAAGVYKAYCVKTKRTLIDNGVRFEGDFNIEVEDFNIEPPSHAFGLIQVNPTMNIEYSFEFNGDKS